MSAVPQSSLGFQTMHESDLGAVMAIEESIYEFPWTRGNFLDSMRAGYTCWIYCDGNEIVGYAVLMNAAGEWHLLNLSIAAAYQRRGHGTGMMDFLVEAARLGKASSMILEVRPSNAGGRRLYEKFGFRQIGLRRDYYPAKSGREDALVLALTL